MVIINIPTESKPFEEQKSAKLIKSQICHWCQICRKYIERCL